MAANVQFPVKTCDVHSNEKLVAYCKRCLDPICIICTERGGNHFGHEKEELGKIARETMAKIPEICEEIRKSDMAKLEQHIGDIENVISGSDNNYQKESEKIQKFRDIFLGLSVQIFDRMVDGRRAKNEKCTVALKECLSNAVQTKENIEERMRGHEENRFNYSNCDVMEVIKQLKIIVGDIQLEDPSGKVHCDLANDDADVEKIKSEIERVIHELLFPRAAKDWFIDDQNIIAIGNILPQKEYLVLGCSLGMNAKEVKQIFKDCGEDQSHLMPNILLQWRKKCSNKDEQMKIKELLSVLRELGLKENADAVEDMYKQKKVLCYDDI